MHEQEYAPQSYGVNGNDEKITAAHIETLARAPMEAPELVKAMTPEYRIAAEQKLKRKLDIRLLPMLILMYIMNYLDRNNIASARLAGKVGLEDTLNLSPTQYNTSVSILFVGYILMQVPSNLFLNKIGKPAIYLPTVMIIWGVISAATAAVTNYAGLIAIRFFLGFVEAAYFPGCLFILSSWYTRKELALRTALLYSGSLISGAFSGLIAAGVSYGLDGSKGIAAWRWLFIIEGAVTVFIAIFAYWVLPNFPRTTTWLTEEERQLAVWRLQEDIGVDDWTSTKDQHPITGFTLALKDPKVYLLGIILIGIVSTASVTNFFPSVVKTLGFNNINTLLLTAPPYVLAVITVAANAWHADRTGERYFHIVLPLFISVAVFIIAVSTTNIPARYTAMMLMPASFFSGYVVVLAWISNTLPRPPAKRAAALALINAASNATSIYASYMYTTKYAPRYAIAFGVDCGTAVMAVVAATVLRFMLVGLNKKLDRGEHVEGTAMAREVANMDEAETKGFRFLI